MHHKRDSQRIGCPFSVSSGKSPPHNTGLKKISELIIMKDSISCGPKTGQRQAELPKKRFYLKWPWNVLLYLVLVVLLHIFAIPVILLFKECQDPACVKEDQQQYAQEQACRQGKAQLEEQERLAENEELRHFKKTLFGKWVQR